MNIFSLNFHVHAAPKPTLKYSWKETTYSTTVVKVMDQDSYVINYSGRYSDVQTTDFKQYEIDEVEDTFTNERRKVTIDSNYTYFLNETITMNMTLKIDISVYQVEIDYGTGLKVYWFALKQGTIEKEHYHWSTIRNLSFYEKCNNKIENTFEKYNRTTLEFLNTWTTTDVIPNEINKTIDQEWSTEGYFYDIQEFSLPVILTTQIFTTESGDKIAWANLLYDFLVFEDEDQNSIYSVCNDPNMNGIPTMKQSTENRGWIRPMATSNYREEIDFTHDLSSNNSYCSPTDKSIDEIASTIQFEPPTSISDTDVSWQIQYPDFPILAYIEDDLGTTYFTEYNKTYARTSPTNLTYGFNYNISNGQADMGITFEMGKLTNNSLYNAVQDYGLVFPQYNYFLSSFNIDEIEMKELAVPAKDFSFESNGTTVAEIKMEALGKDNYTLYDYPTSGTNSKYPSKGGSIHPIVIQSHEFSGFQAEPLVNLIYLLEDYVSLLPSFTIQDNHFSLQTQNYPIWSGNHLVHDPTLSIFFESTSESTDDDGGDDTPSSQDIPGFVPIFVVGIMVTTITIQIIRKKKKLK